MAKTASPAPATFEINAEWVENLVQSGEIEIDRTVCRLSIKAGDDYVTAYKSDKGDVRDKVDVPAYIVADWMASNWWALLYEPRRTDADDDEEYLFRHWLGSARRGFALPNVYFNPVGDKIEVDADETYLRSARLSFTTKSRVLLPRQVFEEGAARFIDSVVQRLEQSEVRDTDAQVAWELVRATTEEEAAYCRLVGALGLNPYDDNTKVDIVLEEAAATLPADVLLDLCQASDEQSFPLTARLSAELFASLDQAQSFDATPLESIDIPADTGDAAAAKWGVAASQRLRQRIGVTSNDPSGGAELFNVLGIDPTLGVSTHSGADFSKIMAALKKENQAQIKLGLAEESVEQRKFSAARAVFLAWEGKRTGKARFVTNAKTRDQQASRAFAAEMLAPIAYIRGQIPSGGAVSMYSLDRIAQELEVSPWVVRWQAAHDLRLKERLIP
jgi:hypothetical protein